MSYKTKRDHSNLLWIVLIFLRFHESITCVADDPGGENESELWKFDLYDAMLYI